MVILVFKRDKLLRYNPGCCLMKWRKLFNKITGRKSTEKKTSNLLEDFNISGREEYVNKLRLASSLEENIRIIKDLFGDSFDLNIREITIGKEKTRAALISMTGLTDPQSIEEIIEALQIKLLHFQELESDHILELITERALNNQEIQITEKMSIVLKETSTGSSIILIDGIPEAIICDTRGFQVRHIEEPESEIVIRGPRDSFVENIFTNTSLIRQRIRVPHLWIQKYEMGSLSKVNVAIAYIKGLTSDELVAEVKSRLERIDIDAVLESGYIEEFLYDEPVSLFPLIKRTERPDKVVSCLLEGKVAVLTDGSPFVLLMPVNLFFFLQAPDDYYEIFPIGSFIRILRYIAFLISIFLPGVYVSVINFHPELLPVSLLLRITAAREVVPFPVIVEALLMEGLFEVLREAGLRLPRAIGSAISIVGALVLGEAAINAGLVSPPMVIIVALTAISSFTTPDYTLGITARLLRFVFLILGSTVGLYGIQLGLLILLIHLCSLRSFGQPYFQPFGPLVWQDLKDSIVRLPWWRMVTRPRLLGGREPQRMKKGQKPGPPTTEKGESKDEK
jgi:spore germination protein KA